MLVFIISAAGKYLKGVRYIRKSIFLYKSMATEMINVLRSIAVDMEVARFTLFVIAPIPAPMAANISWIIKRESISCRILSVIAWPVLYIFTNIMEARRVIRLNTIILNRVANNFDETIFERLTGLTNRKSMILGMSAT